MAVYLEFAILGPPVSNQQSTANGRSNLTAWRATIAGAARSLWARPLLTDRLKAAIINFHAGNRPSVDVDNMSKPILDVMQDIIYQNDRQIVQAEIAHVNVDGAFFIAGASKRLVMSLQAGEQFVYVRIEDPREPFPLPGE